MPRNTLKYLVLFGVGLSVACGSETTKKNNTTDVEIDLGQDVAADSSGSDDVGIGSDDASTTPTIDSIIISPDSISAASTGMTDQFVSVTLGVSGFNAPINVEGTRIFLEANGVDGDYQSATLTGDTIQLTNIAISWFQGLEPGEYSVAAEVVSQDGDDGEPTETITQLGLATITITP